MINYKSNRKIYHGGDVRLRTMYPDYQKTPVNTIPTNPDCPPCPPCPTTPIIPTNPDIPTTQPIPNIPLPNRPPQQSKNISDSTWILGVTGLVSVSAALGAAAQYGLSKRNDGMDERYDLRQEHLQFL